WLHRFESWRFLRLPIAGLGALTLWVQLLNNAVHVAPDASEAPWRRHASLFWSSGATTPQTRTECNRVTDLFPRDRASAFVPPDMPAVLWYLRDLLESQDPEDANVAVKRVDTGAVQPASEDERRFVLQESWRPDLSTLTLTTALRFILTAQSWSAVDLEQAEITFHGASETTAPTVIVPPSPSAGQSAASPSPEGEPSPTETATPSPTPTPSAEPTPDSSTQNL